VSWTGIPGLSSIPILKYLFGSKDHTISDDELVFLVVPHIVRTQIAGSGEPAHHRYRRGPDDRTAPRRPVRTPGDNPVSRSGSRSQAPLTVAPKRGPTVGVVPGQSAMAAAPAALAQLSASADANSDAANGRRPPLQPRRYQAARLQVQPSPAAHPAASVPGQPAHREPDVQPPARPGGRGNHIPGSGGADRRKWTLPRFPCRFSTIRPAFAGQRDQRRLLGRDNQAVALVHRDDGRAPSPSTPRVRRERRSERGGRGLRPQFPGQAAGESVRSP
jgi:general secretion pathway protein D